MHNDALVTQLEALERKFTEPGDSRNYALQKVADALAKIGKPRMPWTNKRIYAVLAGDHPGNKLERAIALLYMEEVMGIKRGRRTHDRKRWRLHVEFADRATWELVRRNTTGEERSQMIQWLAEQEQFD